MFGIGMPEMILILAVALIVIGPKKLPDLAKSLGKALGEFKKATSELKESMQIDTEMKEVRRTFQDLEKDIKKETSRHSDRVDAKTADTETAEDLPGGSTPEEADPSFQAKLDVEQVDQRNTYASRDDMEASTDGDPMPLDADSKSQMPKG